MEERNDQLKNWNIGLVYSRNEMGDTALQHALQLCRVFKAGLVIFSNEPGVEMKNFLKEIVANINLNHKLRCNAFHLLMPYKSWLQEACIRNEVILLSVGHDTQKTTWGKSLGSAMRELRRYKTPYILVPVHSVPGKYEEVAMVLSYPKEEKEKILWASYFGRINKSKIRVLIPKARDQFFLSGIKGNIQALKKLYINAEVNFDLVDLEVSVYKTEQKTVDYINLNDVSALIVLTSRNVDIFDFFEGTSEKKLAKASFKVPVLCINPRDDLYVLCN